MVPEWPEVSPVELDTPTLVVDRNRLEANLMAMSRAAERRCVQLRPHVKTHKAVIIAQMQIGRGASGLTGYGSIVEHPTLSITTLYDHHAIVTGPPHDLLNVGDVVWIVPNHVCPVVDPIH